MRVVSIIRADGGCDDFLTYNVKDFPYDQIADLHLNCVRKWVPGACEHYHKNICAFDIETTTIETEEPWAFMYHWQFCIDGLVCTGRRWEEYFKFLRILREHLSVDINNRLCVYVHNLAFEAQYIMQFLLQDEAPVKVFATDRRKPLRITTGTGIEYRCSYKLTNMTLDQATRNELGVVHIKAHGDLDYRKLRTADTPLDDTEFGYCVSDVVSLYELILCKLRNEGDSLESIPMTSTAYVRRDVRNMCRKDSRYRYQFLKNEFDAEVYGMLQKAFRGGDTHANRFYSGRIMPDVDGFDFVSSYPAQIMLRDFPISKFVCWGHPDSDQELEELCRDYACLFDVLLEDVHAKDCTPFPYIPFSKCREIGTNVKLDNGRVLYAESLMITVTEVDWEIIKQDYDIGNHIVGIVYRAKKGPLPEAFRAAVMKYFREKCDLKHRIREAKKSGDAELLKNLQYLYGKCKNRLNGIYGMCVSSVCHDELPIDPVTGAWGEPVPKDADTQINKFWRSRNSFCAYQWGVWVTAWGRWQLHQLQSITNNAEDGSIALYCDTDSSKAMFVNLDRVEEFNREIRRLCEERGAYCDVDGERFYLGEAEHDCHYEKFKTLGAKKYVDIEDGKLCCTIAGVTKGLAPAELGSIENFVPGFVFRVAGGLTLWYRDCLEEGIHTVTVEGCTMTTAANIAMTDSEYKVGVTGEYAELIGYNYLEDIE